MGMTMMCRTEKMELLGFIRQYYDNINANFEDRNVMRNTKQEAWNTVYAHCKAKGHRWTADATKNGKWLSHIKWPSLKTELKQKIDRQRKTRSDGDIRLNEVDKMILEIIGPKSAELGIEIPQNGNGQSVEYSIINIANSVISEQSSTSTPPPINDKGTKFKTSGLTKRKAQDVKSSDYEKKMNIWLDSKIRLNERMQYKLELEIFKLENELQLSHRYPNVVVKNGKNKE